MNTLSRIVFFLCLGSSFDKLQGAIGHVVTESFHEVDDIQEIEEKPPLPTEVPLLIFSDQAPTMTLEAFEEAFPYPIRCCDCSSRNELVLHQHIKENYNVLDDEVELVVMNKEPSTMSLYAFLIEIQERLKILAAILREGEEIKIFSYYPYVEKKVFKRHINAFNIILARLLVKIDFSEEEKKKLLGLVLPVHERKEDRVLCTFTERKHNPWVVKEIPAKILDLGEEYYYQGHMNGLLNVVIEKLILPTVGIRQTYLILFFLLLSYVDLFLYPNPYSYVFNLSMYAVFEKKYTTVMTPATIYSLVVTFITMFFSSILCYCFSRGKYREKKERCNLLFLSICVSNTFNLGSNLLFPFLGFTIRAFFSFITLYPIFYLAMSTLQTHDTDNISEIEKQLLPLAFTNYKLQQVEVLKTFIENLQLAAKQETIMEQTAFPKEIIAIVLDYSEPFKAQWELCKDELRTYIGDYYKKIVPLPMVCDEQKKYLKRMQRHNKFIISLVVLCILSGTLLPFVAFTFLERIQ